MRFLQGLVTNDVTRLVEAGILYAALLTPQGKYLTDFFLLEGPSIGAGDAILLDAPREAAEDLVRRLMMYRLRAKVEIAPLDLPVSRGLGPKPAEALPDPRQPALGWRLYGHRLAAGAPLDWDALHVDLRIPQHGRDLVPNESYILDFDFPRLNGVDFRKGCYVGQEVTARMHHKAERRRGLFVLHASGPLATGMPVLTADGRDAGRVGTVAGQRALALLRLDRLSEGLRAAGVPVSVMA